MAYWCINTDKNARTERTCDIWHEHGMAFAGDHEEKRFDHAEHFDELYPGDGIFMHESGKNGGFISYGIVQELWDKQAYSPQNSFLYNIGHPKEIYEYRIKVKWLPEYDRRKCPLKIGPFKLPCYKTLNPIDEKKHDIDEILNKLFNGLISDEKKSSDAYISESEIIYEGASKEIIAKFYERNPDARKKCLSHWGFDCCICGFNFKVYGSLGKDYIHVHHIVPISSYDNEHPIDPVKDLCPVCPNCHVMLHRKSPPYTIEELRDYYKES